VYFFDHVHWMEQVCFTGRWRSPAHVNTPNRGSVAKNNCTACPGFQVSVMAYTYAGDISDVVVHILSL
jgi:hypothetical protein